MRASVPKLACASRIVEQSSKLFSVAAAPVQNCRPSCKEAAMAKSFLVSFLVPIIIDVALLIFVFEIAQCSKQ